MLVAQRTLPIKRKNGVYGNIISDKFSTITYNGDQDIIASIPITLASTVDEFKNWLKSNFTTVVYPLQDPVYEEVLNECGEPIILEGYINKGSQTGIYNTDAGSTALQKITNKLIEV